MRKVVEVSSSQASHFLPRALLVICFLSSWAEASTNIQENIQYPSGNLNIQVSSSDTLIRLTNVHMLLGDIVIGNGANVEIQPGIQILVQNCSAVNFQLGSTLSPGMTDFFNLTASAKVTVVGNVFQKIAIGRSHGVNSRSTFHLTNDSSMTFRSNLAPQGFVFMGGEHNGAAILFVSQNSFIHFDNNSVGTTGKFFAFVSNFGGSARLTLEDNSEVKIERSQASSSRNIVVGGASGDLATTSFTIRQDSRMQLSGATGMSVEALVALQGGLLNCSISDNSTLITDSIAVNANFHIGVASNSTVNLIVENGSRLQVEHNTPTKDVVAFTARETDTALVNLTVRNQSVVSFTNNTSPEMMYFGEADQGGSCEMLFSADSVLEIDNNRMNADIRIAVSAGTAPSTQDPPKGVSISFATNSSVVCSRNTARALYFGVADGGSNPTELNWFQRSSLVMKDCLIVKELFFGAAFSSPLSSTKVLVQNSTLSLSSNRLSNPIGTSYFQVCLAKDGNVTFVVTQGSVVSLEDNIVKSDLSVNYAPREGCHTSLLVSDNSSFNVMNNTSPITVSRSDAIRSVSNTTVDLNSSLIVSSNQAGIGPGHQFVVAFSERGSVHFSIVAGSVVDVSQNDFSSSTKFSVGEAYYEDAANHFTIAERSSLILKENSAPSFRCFSAGNSGTPGAVATVIILDNSLVDIINTQQILAQQVFYATRANMSLVVHESRISVRETNGGALGFMLGEMTFTNLTARFIKSTIEIRDNISPMGQLLLFALSGAQLRNSLLGPDTSLVITNNTVNSNNAIRVLSGTGFGNTGLETDGLVQFTIQDSSIEVSDTVAPTIGFSHAEDHTKTALDFRRSQVLFKGNTISGELLFDAMNSSKASSLSEMSTDQVNITLQSNVINEGLKFKLQKRSHLILEENTISTACDLFQRPYLPSFASMITVELKSNNFSTANLTMQLGSPVFGRANERIDFQQNVFEGPESVNISSGGVRRLIPNAAVGTINRTFECNFLTSNDSYVSPWAALKTVGFASVKPLAGCVSATKTQVTASKTVLKPTATSPLSVSPLVPVSFTAERLSSSLPPLSTTPPAQSSGTVEHVSPSLDSRRSESLKATQATEQLSQTLQLPSVTPIRELTITVQPQCPVLLLENSTTNFPLTTSAQVWKDSIDPSGLLSIVAPQADDLDKKNTSATGNVKMSTSNSEQSVEIQEVGSLQIRAELSSWLTVLSSHSSGSSPISFPTMEVVKEDESYANLITATSAATQVTLPTTTVFSSHESNSKLYTAKISIFFAGSSILAEGGSLILTLPLRNIKCSDEYFSLSNFKIGPNITISLHPAIPPPLISGEAQDVVTTIAVTTATTGSTLGSVSGALYQARAGSLVSLGECDFDHEEELDTMISPTGYKFGPKHGQYYRGAVVGNLFLFIGFSVFFAFVFSIVFVGRRLAGVKAKSGDGSWKGDLSDAAATIHFPSVLLVPYALGLQGTVACSMSIFLHSHSTQDVILGVFGGSSCLALLGFFLYPALPCFFKLQLEDRPEENEEGDPSEKVVQNPASSPNALKHPVSTRQRLAAAKKASKIWCKAKMDWLMTGKQHWIDPQPETRWKRRYLFLFYDYNKSWFLALELVVSFILGIIDGIRQNNHSMCLLQAVLSLILFFGMMMLCTWLRPSFTKFQQIFILIVNPCSALAAACLVVALATQNTNGFGQVPTVATMIVGLVGIVKVVMDLWFGVLWIIDNGYSCKQARLDIQRSFLPPTIDVGQEEELQEAAAERNEDEAGLLLLPENEEPLLSEVDEEGCEEDEDLSWLPQPTEEPATEEVKEDCPEALTEDTRERIRIKKEVSSALGMFGLPAKRTTTPIQEDEQRKENPQLSSRLEDLL